MRPTCKLLADLGLWGYHPYSSRRSTPGWPDWTIIGPRKVIFRELKSEYGRVTPEQQRVGDMLTRTGQSWRVWRPSDQLSGQIARELTEIAAVQGSLFPSGPTT